MAVGDAQKRPHVVILGGGFAGLAAAREVAPTGCRVTLVDRRNHHLFQPLLYQVATAALSPAQIASPIRTVLARWRNVDVVLSEARSIDLASRTVRLSDGDLAYDALVVAAGATHSYFGHDEWARHAPGLKTIQDALTIRSEYLDAFERADRETDLERRRAELTFVIVGGGPTGVEMAGAMAEIAHHAISREYRHIDTKTAQVILVEGQGRLLPTFPEELSARTRRDLESLGVRVRLNCKVVGIDAGSVDLETGEGREHLPARHIVWAAGVRAEAISRTLGVELDHAGRVKVAPDLSVPGHPEVIVVGDLAHVQDADGQMVPGVAPAAMQMGRFAGRVIAKEVRSGELPAAPGAPPRRDAFVYRDKGMLATIGRARAVAKIGRVMLAGFAAWALWALVHVFYLISFRKKVLVMLEWAWSYVFFHRGARLIYRELNPDPAPGRPDEPATDAGAQRGQTS